MEIKNFLKQNIFTKNIYSYLWNIKKQVVRNHERKKNLSGKFIFTNRSTASDKLCIVLAGYKNFLIPTVMVRLKKFAPNDIDICIITSGKWSEEINLLCKENHWSYLSTKRNNVSLAQNIAINLHKSAKYIFKLDEDIFITKNYFSKLLTAYQMSKDTTYYNCGVMAPTIPINGFGHVRILEYFNLVDFYRKTFGQLKIAAGPERKIESDPQLARFMWGEKMVCDGREYSLPSIDEMNEVFEKMESTIESCSIRFSIGAILFERKLWEEMNFFHVSDGTDMGADEVQLCEFCMIKSKPIMISENIVVGHLAFGQQNESMKEYYLNNKDKFTV